MARRPTSWSGRGSTPARSARTSSSTGDALRDIPGLTVRTLLHGPLLYHAPPAAPTAGGGGNPVLRRRLARGPGPVLSVIPTRLGRFAAACRTSELAPHPPRCVVERAIDREFFLGDHLARGYPSR